MKKIITKELFRSAVITLALTVSVLAAVSPMSCKLTEEGIEFVPKDTLAPEVQGFSVTGSSSVLIECSEKIVLDEISIIAVDDDMAESDEEEFNLLNGENVFAVANAVTYSEDGKSAEVEFSSPTNIGKSYIFSGVVYDITGNSLEFSQKFWGYNENPAKLIFNEVRTAYKKDSSKGEHVIEFIEFYVLKSGNLGGLEVVSGAYGEGKKYSFPPINVSQNEFITLHTRVLDDMTETAIDELGEDFALSSAFGSCDSSRDLWVNQTKRIVNATDVLVVRNTMTESLVDAVLFRESDKEDWSNDLEKEFANTVSESGIWNPDSSVKNAIVNTSGSTSAYRTISRQNTRELSEKYADESEVPEIIPTSADDWIVTTGSKNNSGATPGFENSTVEYTK